MPSIMEMITRDFLVLSTIFCPLHRVTRGNILPSNRQPPQPPTQQWNFADDRLTTFVILGLFLVIGLLESQQPNTDRRIVDHQKAGKYVNVVESRIMVKRRQKETDRDLMQAKLQEKDKSLECERTNVQALKAQLSELQSLLCTVECEGGRQLEQTREVHAQQVLLSQRKHEEEKKDIKTSLHHSAVQGMRKIRDETEEQLRIKEMQHTQEIEQKQGENIKLQHLLKRAQKKIYGLEHSEQHLEAKLKDIQGKHASKCERIGMEQLEKGRNEARKEMEMLRQDLQTAHMKNEESKLNQQQLSQQLGKAFVEIEEAKSQPKQVHLDEASMEGKLSEQLNNALSQSRATVQQQSKELIRVRAEHTQQEQQGRNQEHRLKQAIKDNILLRQQQLSQREVEVELRHGLRRSVDELQSFYTQATAEFDNLCREYEGKLEERQLLVELKETTIQRLEADTDGLANQAQLASQEHNEAGIKKDKRIKALEESMAKLEEDGVTQAETIRSLQESAGQREKTAVMQAARIKELELLLAKMDRAQTQDQQIAEADLMELDSYGSASCSFQQIAQAPFQSQSQPLSNFCPTTSLGDEMDYEFDGMPTTANQMQSEMKVALDDHGLDSSMPDAPAEIRSANEPQPLETVRVQQMDSAMSDQFSYVHPLTNHREPVAQSNPIAHTAINRPQQAAAPNNIAYNVGMMTTAQLLLSTERCPQPATRLLTTRRSTNSTQRSNRPAVRLPISLTRPTPVHDPKALSIITAVHARDAMIPKEEVAVALMGSVVKRLQSLTPPTTVVKQLREVTTDQNISVRNALLELNIFYPRIHEYLVRRGAQNRAPMSERTFLESLHWLAENRDYGKPEFKIFGPHEAENIKACAKMMLEKCLVDQTRHTAAGASADPSSAHPARGPNAVPAPITASSSSTGVLDWTPPPPPPEFDNIRWGNPVNNATRMTVASAPQVVASRDLVTLVSVWKWRVDKGKPVRASESNYLEQVVKTITPHLNVALGTLKKADPAQYEETRQNWFVTANWMMQNVQKLVGRGIDDEEFRVFSTWSYQVLNTCSHHFPENQ